MDRSGGRPASPGDDRGRTGGGPRPKDRSGDRPASPGDDRERTGGGPRAKDRSAARLAVGIDASRGFGPRPTGTERYAHEVICHLVGQDRHDYRLYFRAPPLAPPLAPPEGAAVRVLPARRLWTHRRLAAEIARHPPDVLYVPAHVMPLGCRTPTVVTVHDLGYLAFPEAHPLAQRLYLHWSTRRHVRLAAVVVADSAATRDDLITRYGASSERIVVAPLGVSARMRPVDAEAVGRARQGLGLPGDRAYLLHVGTLQPRKNLARLLRAFARLAGDHPEVDLVLAGGRGWGREDLPRLARELGLADRVRFAGYVPEADLPAIYTGARALVMPSLYEGFGLPVLEAMACGTPVAASRSSSLVEVVGQAGLLFDPLDVRAMASALERLVRDDDLRSDLIDAGRRRASAFTWSRCAEIVRAALEVGARRSAGT